MKEKIIEKVIELVEKYYIFTLIFIVLAVALYGFRADKDIANIIIGCFIGLLSAPAVLPKSKE